MAIRWGGKQLKQNDNTGLTDDSDGDLSGGLRQGYELGCLTDGLVAYFPFDGTVEDKALSRSVTDNTSAGFVSGQIGQAKDFDGNDDYLNIVPEAFKTSKAFTLNVRVSKNGNSRQDFVAGDSSTPGPRMIRYWDNTDSWQFTFTDDSGSSYTIRGGSPNDNWTQLTGVYNGEKMLFYENGSLIGSKSVGSVSPTNIDNHYNIGRNPADVNYLNGQLDELRFYDRALSKPEIQALYNRTQTQKITDKDRLTSGLVGHWPLNEDNASNAYDLSGKGLDASSVTGTSTTVGLGGAKARSFEGSDYIDIGDFEVFTSDQFTYSAFVRINSVSSRQRVVQKAGGGGSREYIFTIEDDGTGTGVMYADVGDTNGDWDINYISSVVIPVGEWVHLAWVIDSSSSEVRFYKDGSLGDSVDYSGGGLKDTNEPLEIGGIPESSDGLNGKIADARIYNRALTKSVIEELARQGGL